ncbi:unnamed protein product [Darwinula stevensoni]|uniref:Uncharacterized protein n=1 Tax=Darwinula stevensoni TaxID=69355 RepID=A0A7R8XJ94_9CRUS|nr:unnamed protein product [Darwinula stevensoni]CAG0895080.1 unnamed protein product [Darwinula stevensoni]
MTEISCPFGDQQRMHKDSLPMLLSRDAFTISRSPMNTKNSIYQDFMNTLYFYSQMLPNNLLQFHIRHFEERHKAEKCQRLTSETAAELKRLYQETCDRMTIQQDPISEEVYIYIFHGNISLRTRKDSEEAPKGRRILNFCPFGDQQRMHKESLPILLSSDAFTISCCPMNMKNSLFQICSWGLNNQWAQATSQESLLQEPPLDPEGKGRNFVREAQFREKRGASALPLIVEFSHSARPEC